MFAAFKCFVLGHDRKYWPKEKVAAHHVMGGVFTPYVCRRCGHESPPFPYPRVHRPGQ